MIGFICVMSAGAFWPTGTLLVFYLLHVIEKFHVIPWMLVEMVFCSLWSFFYFTAALDTAVNASSTSAFGAAALRICCHGSLRI